jgi:hypothetical protein
MRWAKRSAPESSAARPSMSCRRSRPPRITRSSRPGGGARNGSLSPHAAFYSVPGQADLRRKAIETVVSYLRDGTLRNCVNLEYLAKQNA